MVQKQHTLRRKLKPHRMNPIASDPAKIITTGVECCSKNFLEIA